MTLRRRILVTGGTGYVGSRLIPLLRDRSAEFLLRLMARKPEYLRARVGDDVEIVAGDVTKPETLSDALRDVDTAYYLTHALEHEAGASRIYEIGGPDQVSYGDLMREDARQRGLKRLMMPVPFLSARLSSLWLGLVTPVYATIGRKLVESLKNPTVVNDKSALTAFPLRPMSLTVAIERALSNEDHWYSIWPLHQFVFAGMLRNLAAAAENVSVVQETSAHV